MSLETLFIREPAVNPPDYSREGDAIVHELQNGELLREHPHRLFELLACAPPEHTAALARLLGPLFCDPISQTREVRKLAEWMRREPATESLVRELFADQIKQNRIDVAADCAAY